MGKSGGLLRSLAKAFKSPSKDKNRHNLDGDPKDHQPLDKEQTTFCARILSQKKVPKEKRRWSLGKSSSRNHRGSENTPPPPFTQEKQLTITAIEPTEVLQVPTIIQLADNIALNKPEPRTLDANTAIPSTDSKHVQEEDSCVTLATDGNGQSSVLTCEKTALTHREEEWAATKIQTAFRCYFARQALGALKGLVQLQALARGRIVRRQAAITLRCIQALVRVQARVRARRVRQSEEGQVVQRHLQQLRRQQPPKDGWDNSTASLEQMHAKGQSKKEAAMKRERALAYAFSEQLRRCAPKQSSLVIDYHPDKGHWGWSWLERWMVAKPWENEIRIMSNERILSKKTEGTDNNKMESNYGMKRSPSLTSPDIAPTLTDTSCCVSLPRPPSLVFLDETPKIDAVISLPNSASVSSETTSHSTPQEGCGSDSIENNNIESPSSPKRNFALLTPTVFSLDEKGIEVDGNGHTGLSFEVLDRTSSLEEEESHKQGIERNMNAIGGRGISPNNVVKRSNSGTVSNSNIVSPPSISIPSYMAPTQSAKAKARSAISPKTSNINKQDTPSPSSSSSRRHSLSGSLDNTKGGGLSSSASSRRISHIRSSSKGGNLRFSKDPPPHIMNISDSNNNNNINI